jgi:hypothetical protein
MKFANPDILYALLLLLIPVIVHLFKFQRFRKLVFPNVTFLKNVEKESRKSRKLRKFIVLLTRMLMLAFLILAFAKPYIPSRNERVSPEKYIVFDRSMSTSYFENKQSVFTSLVGMLQEVVSEDETYFLVDNGIKENKGKDLVKSIMESGFSPYVFAHEDAIRQIKLTEQGPKSVFYFTDLQFFNENALREMAEDSLTRYHLVVRKPAFPRNAWIDTLYLVNNTLEVFTLGVVVKATGNFDLVLDLFAADNLLYKKDLRIKANGTDTVFFEVPKRYKVKSGKIVLQGEKLLPFDNQLYFKIPQPLTYKVLIAGKRIPRFFRTLYEHPGIEIKIFEPGKIPWADLEQYDLLVFTGWEPFYNFDLLNRYLSKGKMIFIPDFEDTDLLFYNRMGWKNVKIDTLDREIVHIAYGHPFFRDVFKKREQKFKAPQIDKTYLLPRKGDVLLATAGNQPFLIKKGNIFIFSASIDRSNSNFYLSPLMIPVFFKPLWMHSGRNLLYRYIDKNLQFTVKVDALEKPVEIRSGNVSFIPYQEHTGKELNIFPENYIKKPGIYYVINQKDTVDVLALNYNRKESVLKYLEKETDIPRNVRFYNSVKSLKPVLVKGTKDLSFWFIILAILLFITEMLMLRFWKWN